MKVMLDELRQEAGSENGQEVGRKGGPMQHARMGTPRDLNTHTHTVPASSESLKPLP
jgi:hypothetical protein